MDGEQAVWTAEDELEWEEELADMDVESYTNYQARVRQPFLHGLFLKHALFGLDERARGKIEKFVREGGRRQLGVAAD